MNGDAIRRLLDEKLAPEEQYHDEVEQKEPDDTVR